MEARELLWPQGAEALARCVEENLGGKVFVRSRPEEHFHAGVLLEQVGRGVLLGEEMEVDGYFLGASALEAFFSGCLPVRLHGAGARGGRRGRGLQVHRGHAARRAGPRPAGGLLPGAVLLGDRRGEQGQPGLTRTLMGGRRQGSLLSVIDETITAMGGRRLRQWLGYPLVDRPRIEARLARWRRCCGPGAAPGTFARSSTRSMTWNGSAAG